MGLYLLVFLIYMMLYMRQKLNAKASLGFLHIVLFVFFLASRCYLCYIKHS